MSENILIGVAVFASRGYVWLAFAVLFSVLAVLSLPPAVAGVRHLWEHHRSASRAAEARTTFDVVQSGLKSVRGIRQGNPKH